MIRKISGIETEYGILVRGAEQNPVLASSILINAYLQSVSAITGWDFIAEHPEMDARGAALRDVFPPEVESHLVNAVLRNGSRYYVDHAHPEISTPECASPLDVLKYDLAAEEIVRLSVTAANEILPGDSEVLLYKNNSDGKGNSYGCHENYLVDRAVNFDDIVQGVTAHFVTRQIFCGAGKIGVENQSQRRANMPNNPFNFQISQRADFFEAEVGLETTLKRPIVNTRDEPHCDPRKYRRLHVICGDANMSQTATFLKVASTCVVLAMIEDGLFPKGLQLLDPVKAVQVVSSDPSLRCAIELRNGKEETALDIQREICALALDYLSQNTECIGTESAQMLTQLWPQILDSIRDRTDFALRTVDWIAKERIIMAYAERHGIVGEDPKLKLLDLQYHDMRPAKCLAGRANLIQLVDETLVDLAINEPPEDTRAYFRGKCVSKWPRDVVSANWDSMVVDIGGGELRRIAMQEPQRGTRDLIGSLVDKAVTTQDLVRLLGHG